MIFILTCENSPRLASAIFQAIVNVDHMITVELLQLKVGKIANGNNKMLGIIRLQVTIEDKQSFTVYSNTSCPTVITCCYLPI